MMQSNIRHIIFDLGDVILNIDIPRTLKAFSALTGQDEESLFLLFRKTELFRRFETGSLSAPEFRNVVREVLEMPELQDDQIDNAWNALLLDIPPARITLLQQLAQRYELFLLSNTSSIHIDKVNLILKENNGIPDLQNLFKKVFLSYEMGIMKPDPAIYQMVLDQAGIEAQHTLFLDDNHDNINAANLLGIHTIHVQKPTTILEYLVPYA